jgi:hypothetical protein
VPDDPRKPKLWVAYRLGNEVTWVPATHLVPLWNCNVSRGIVQCTVGFLFVPFITRNMEGNVREYLRIKDAAALLSVSEGTLRNRSQQGKIQAVG